MRNDFASTDQPEEARRTTPRPGTAESVRRSAGAEGRPDPTVEEHIILGED
ncbi:MULTISPECIES: hypothetical protein [unclassified Streptomyces]|uniref:hypothetical protein n=1 Tax=unclassified Streptomyces TaxID=2593676 RepID=UPI0033D64452